MDLSFPTLQPLLPPKHALFGDEQAQTLSLLTLSPEGRPHLVAQQQLTGNEWRVLMMLIDAYPRYASYAQLLSQVTTCSVVECQVRLKEAWLHGNDAVKRELRPLRDALSSMHPKLGPLSLTVASVQRLGYLLAALE